MLAGTAPTVAVQPIYDLGIAIDSVSLDSNFIVFLLKAR
jgi:hypothetical protein